MGIDKPDNRAIVHIQTPASPEQYVQRRPGVPAATGVVRTGCRDTIRRISRSTSTCRGRPRPHQLRRVAQALAAWAREGKPVSAAHLALSAGVPVTTARGLCAELEQLAIVDVDAGHR